MVIIFIFSSHIILT